MSSALRLAVQRRSSRAAGKALASAEPSQEAGFYTAKQQTSAFVFDWLLPRTRSHKECMLAPVKSVMDMKLDDFSFDHSR